MADLKKLDDLQKPGSSTTNPDVPLNKNNPEFGKPEKIGRTILAAAAAKGGKAPSGKAAPTPKEEMNIKMAKIRKIKLYMGRFPKLEDANIRVPSINSSSAEIDEILFDIHKFMNTQSGERYIPLAIQQMFLGIETATMIYGVNPMNWDLTGLGSVTNHAEVSKRLNEVAAELYIEYEEWFTAGPLTRFTAEVLGIMMAVDKNNKGMRQVVNAENVRMMEEERRAMNDLNKTPSKMEEMD
jgi:hypothetical protein